MPFGIDFGDILDTVTDWIPGGIDDMLFDDLFTSNGNGNGTPANGNGTARTAAPRTSSNGRAHAHTNGACPPTVAFDTKQVAECPPGYVAVDTDNDGRTDTCMLKAYARECKLWKPKAKPPIKARDYKQMRTAKRVADKLMTIAKDAESLGGKARRNGRR